MNPYLEVVDRLKIPTERYQAAQALSAGGRGARQNRGKQLPMEKVEALIWVYPTGVQSSVAAASNCWTSIPISVRFPTF